MKRSRFTEEQIIGVLREHEAGAKTGELARKHGISEATLYNWRAKFGGMNVSEAQRLRALEEENRRLKSLLADAMLDKAALSELLSKKWYGPPRCARASLIFGRCSRSVSGGPARSSRPTARWSATRPDGRRTRLYVNACRPWRLSDDASAIGGCSSCFGAKARPRARTASIGSTARKG